MNIEVYTCFTINPIMKRIAPAILTTLKIKYITTTIVDNNVDETPI